MLTAALAACVLAAAVAPRTAAAQDAAAGDSPQISVRTLPEELTGVPAIVDKVDAAFAGVVGVMNTVLFYELFSSDYEILTYTDSETYVRSERSGDAFKPLIPGGEYAEIDVQTGAKLQAEGRLISGQVIDGEERYYSRGVVVRDGQEDGKVVEFVELKKPRTDPAVAYGDVYVKSPDSDVFRLQLPLRDQLSDEETLTPEEAKALSTQPGFTLKTVSKSGIPIVVLWLFLGSIFFTLKMGFVNVWGFGHAVQIVRGKYDDPNEPGEVSHAQALASALSATVGLGNISGVAIAVVAGGPGAFFWMMVTGLIGMSSKFTECTLAQKYRTVKSDGTILGGPMRYLRDGLREKGLGGLGAVLAIVFSIMCVLASFGGGNMYQVNQAADQFASVVVDSSAEELKTVNASMAEAAASDDGVRFEELRRRKAELTASIEDTTKWVRLIYGIVMAVGVALVIVGGMKRIGATAGKIVPTMCGVYILACVVVIAMNITRVPEMVSLIFGEAFSGKAVGGGFLGALVVAVTGVRRAAFSNEAGVGSAAIAHAAAKTDEPIREGCVALLEPFIDTVVVCSMTALVILFTGAWNNPDIVGGGGLEGVTVTSAAFEAELGGWFKYVLTVAVVLFAFSTIISWSYYGERAWESLLGAATIPLYKTLAIGCVVLGAVVNLGAVLDFSDMMILTMAFPNILGAAILSGLVKSDLKDYWRRLKAGEMDVDHSAAPATDAAPADG